ncbi:MAG: histidinol-phosphate transaminase [Coriobacteriales bacterium]|jgi:histidinol-phosphate aminotransferase
MAKKSVKGAASQLTGMTPYDPKYLKADVLLSANESPLDVPSEVKDGILSRIKELAFNRYPDPLANNLRVKIAKHWGVKTHNVLLGNGGDELLFDLMLAWGGPGRRMLNFPPTFSVYETNAVLTGTEVVNLPREDDFSIDVDKAVAYLEKTDVDFVVLTNPNNPTGTLTPVADVKRILDATDGLVLVDEAYGEFADQTCLELLEDYENLVILHTFSKAYRCAGIRLGYLLANDAVLDELKKVRQPYSVDAISQIVGEEVMDHADLFEPSIAETCKLRDELVERLGQMEGVKVYPSRSNFILFHVISATEMWKRLHKRHSVLIRNVSGDRRVAGCLRVSVGTKEENERFLAALDDVLTTFTTS